MRNTKTRIGRRFGRLKVIAVAKKRNDYKKRWACICDCGSLVEVRDDALTREKKPTQSCGCYFRECIGRINLKHGQSRTPGYRAWIAMKGRCLNPSAQYYSHYGGRGITVCERWLRFENFIEDMGQPLAGLTLERENNSGNYEPSNCKWATRLEQSNNTRSNRRIRLNGELVTIAQACRELGVKRHVIEAIIKPQNQRTV